MSLLQSDNGRAVLSRARCRKRGRGSLRKYWTDRKVSGVDGKSFGEMIGRMLHGLYGGIFNFFWCKVDWFLRVERRRRNDSRESLCRLLAGVNGLNGWLGEEQGGQAKIIFEVNLPLGEAAGAGSTSSCADSA